MEENITLENFLNNIERTKEKLTELYIYNELRKLKVSSNENEELKIEYESIAFGLSEGSLNKSNNSGNHFGPTAILNDNVGNRIEIPDTNSIENKTIEYWGERVMKAKHPIIILRYADLVWEFSKKITGKPADIKMAQFVIDNTLLIIESKQYDHELNAMIKLKRALSIVLSINDNNRKDKLIQCIIKFEDDISTTNGRNIWGFAFDCLIDTRKILADTSQEDKIINDLEAKVKILSKNDENLDANAVESGAVRLLRYYRSRNDKANIERILKIYGQSYIWTAERNKGLIASHWLQKVYELYISNGLKKEAEIVSQLLVKVNSSINEEMKEISQRFSIDKEQYQKSLEKIVGNNLKEAFNNIVQRFLPNDEDLKKDVIKGAKIAPLYSSISQSIIDRDGRTVARIGTVEEDIEGRVIQLMTQRFQIEWGTLYDAIRETRKKYNFTTDDIINFIYESPLFLEERKEIIKRGIEAYSNDDFIIAAHVLIPQIENALRIMLKLNGGDIYKPAKNGGLFLRNLDEILRSSIICENFSENVTKYLRVLLTDQRGFNLRNDICHGIIPPDHIGFYVCDRIFHVLLLLGQVRTTEINL